MLPSLPIASGQGEYRVDFFDAIPELLAELEAEKGAMIICDGRIADLYRERLQRLFSVHPVHLVAATEDEKTFEGAKRFLDFLQINNAVKQTLVIAIGGGIIQDIATIATLLYFRGLRWVFVPTTLLAMCDSSIGAKSGINLNGFKNQLGAFNAPRRILIAMRFLDTLAEADICSGYGEILKLLLTGSREQYERLEQAVDTGGWRNPHLEGLIYESLLVKKGVIEVDEYERDLRRILNYGHTFGHALESLTDHGLPHGTAVAWGIDLVNWIAMRRGLLSAGDYARIHAFIARHWTCRVAKPFDADGLIQGTRRDKKVHDGKLTLIILERPGSLRVVPVAFDSELRQQVGDYLLSDSVVRSAT